MAKKGGETDRTDADGGGDRGEDRWNAPRCSPCRPSRSLCQKFALGVTYVGLRRTVNNKRKLTNRGTITKKKTRRQLFTNPRSQTEMSPTSRASQRLVHEPVTKHSARTECRSFETPFRSPLVSQPSIALGLSGSLAIWLSGWLACLPARPPARLAGWLSGSLAADLLGEASQLAPPRFKTGGSVGVGMHSLNFVLSCRAFEPRSRQTSEVGSLPRV